MDLFCSRGGGQCRTVDLFCSHGGQTIEMWNCSMAVLDIVHVVLIVFIF